MVKRNIIFIDVDGPLIPDRYWLSMPNVEVLAEAKGLMGVLRSNFEIKRKVKFDPVAVWMFNMWFKYSNAIGVLSTNWAQHTSVTEMKELFKLNGLDIQLHEDCITPKKLTSHRCNEIQWWLDAHQKEVLNYIAVDDDFYMNPKSLATTGSDDYAFMGTRTVYVDFDMGLTRQNFVHGCNLLGIDLEKLNQNELRIAT